MESFLITGGAGFFGDILKARLLEDGAHCVSIDLMQDPRSHDNLVSIKGDISDKTTLERLFSQYEFDAVYHCAAMLAHGDIDRDTLDASNIEGTRNIAEMANRFKVPKVLFTSSNCLWAEPFGRPVTEDDIPNPIEDYGKSKWEAEKILLDDRNIFEAAIVRCPTIIDKGRLGLLAILFEFIDEGRKIWLIGGGGNRYQFIYSQDLCSALIGLQRKGSHGIFNVGSDDVKNFREVYNHVIDKAQTGARVASLPRWPTLAMMRLAHRLHLSPLGPYQYRMIAEDFIFNTDKIKAELGWSPTLTNEQMLYMAYEYYRDHRDEIRNRTGVSAHRKASNMGIIKLLKYLS